tara:strand:- start:656 stop:874 length:219 start_codon:yes stop_codon:yes gene_type:complete
MHIFPRRRTGYSSFLKHPVQQQIFTNTRKTQLITSINNDYHIIPVAAATASAPAIMTASTSKQQTGVINHNE